MQMFFSTLKSLGGHAKMSITSLYVKIIKFRLALDLSVDRIVTYKQVKFHTEILSDC